MEKKLGTVTLMGSGELADSMSRVHRALLNELDDVNAVFLDTPAGFETNADEISAKAVEYFAHRFSVPLDVASFKHHARATAVDVEAALRELRHANYIFAGPGSPTYAIRNWRGSAVWDTVLMRLAQGAQIVFASAAAIASSCHALPVYEMYKVGEDPHWVDGLDMFGAYGLNLAVVPHWNNTEGGEHDTRYCYMGAARFDMLEQQLPPGAVILGIDEYTACIIDLAGQQCQVMGAGGVTVRHRGAEWNYPAGMTFGFERLRARSLTPPGSEAPLASHTAPVEMDSESTADGAFAEATRYLFQLAQALDETRETEIQRDLIDQAHDTMHELKSEWIDTAPAATQAEIAPFIRTLIELRGKLRSLKLYALADEVRDKLAQQGIQLEDTSSGTMWKKVEK